MPSIQVREQPQFSIGFEAGRPGMYLWLGWVAILVTWGQCGCEACKAERKRAA